jgi:hypothetical protein
VLAEGVDERVEVLPDVVQRDVVEAEGGQLVQPLGVSDRWTCSTRRPPPPPSR